MPSLCLNAASACATSAQPTMSVPCRPLASPGASAWNLPRGRAVSVTLRAATVLRATSGRAWVTQDAPLGAPGDYFVFPGHDLPLRAGQSVVIEAWPYPGQDEVALQWLAQPETCK